MSRAIAASEPVPRSSLLPADVKLRSRRARSVLDRGFVIICMLAAAMSLVVLAVLLVSILLQGVRHVDLGFVLGVPSRDPALAGIWPALVGTILTCLVCAATAIPIGIATAILLEEFKPRHRYLKRAHHVVQLNITNLAGVPSIVYGILGLTLFVQMFNQFGTQLDPAAEIGVQWHDRFLTEGQRQVQVPVEGRGAPTTVVSADLPFTTVEGEPVTDLRIIPRDELAPLLGAVSDRVATFEDAMDPTVDDLDETSDEALRTAAEAAWTAADLQADRAAVLSQFVQAMGEARGQTGRDRRRLVRNAWEVVETAELRATLPGVLAADAVPSRVADVQPWYVRIPFGRGVLAGGLTLMLVVLPVIIISTQEALRAVSSSLRHGSLALGATRWQTVWKVTLPAALPGIMTGTILAMSRAIGEAAPVLIIAGIVYVTFTPRHLMDDFTVMPLQIFQWASRPQAEFHAVAAAGIILLLAVLLTFNALAIWIRQRAQKQLS